jgi:amino acid adenylation domain-containing protein
VKVHDLLIDLRSLGIEIGVTDDKLTVTAPRGSVTAAIAESLRAHKTEIVSFLKGAGTERNAFSAVPPIVPVARNDEYMPLSFTQERLWYLSQVESNPAVFNLPLCLEITGALDVPLMQRCLDDLARRHEVMRTTVVVRDGIGYQRISAAGALPLNILDLRDSDQTMARSEALKMLDRAAGEPFDLTARPAFRATLARYAEEGFFFLLVIHHMFVDGYSQNILLDELIRSYEAAERGAPSPLKRVDLQFADYAAWQRQWLDGSALDEQLMFWRERLQGAPHVLEVPTDYPRPPMRGSNGSKVPFRLPRAATQRVLTIANEEGATPFMAMLALVNILLHRYSGQDDILVGAPVANRARRESENIVGYVANTLVLRTDCSSSPSFRELLRRVREMCVGAFRHQDMPFQKIVEALRPARDLSRTPIYQVFLTYDEVFVQPTRMGRLKLERVIVGSTVARQDISIFLRRVGDEIHGSLEYSVDLFKRETILRLLESLSVITESASRQPDVPIRQLDVLTGEDQKLLSALNRTELPLPPVLVQDLVEAQAARTPDAVAVRDAHGSLTYTEVMREAEQLAWRLRQRGVQPNDLVGLCVERSARMVVALLGILKAGAAYVPLDPDFPTNRLAFMMEDAQLGVIVCQSSTVQRVSAPHRVLVSLDDKTDARPSSRIDSGVTPDSRAYVIYTSGSTGRPKGVELLHRNVVNCLTAFARRPGIGSDAVLVAVTTLSFDIAVLELLLPLIAGGTVVVASRDVATDGVRLAQLLKASRPTMMQATPATWRLLLDAGWAGHAGLRALCGGEALPQDLAAALLPKVGELWNMYGPTETTVWSTCTRVIDPSRPISIGTPIGNTTIRVVDKQGAQVPVGVPGELLIGGLGVAKGYLGRTELTAERFVLDPTESSANDFYYRTGDIVRLTADGELYHLGRSDDQVKVRGFRIELGEIEAVLRDMPAIQDAVVSVHGRNRSDARLVAYVIFGPAQHPTVSEVRRFVRDRLPQYMVPSAIVELESIPRTPNGKVDRSGLPDPSSGTRERRHEPPHTPMEHLIAETWRTLLSIDRIGRHDNFFELGGHSLLSMRAAASIERQTGVRIDPRLFFFQTVEQIAVAIPTSAVAKAS